MQVAYLERLFAHLQLQGIKLEDGLSDAEVKEVERTFSFRFPPDLKALLQFALPISDRFVDWRNGSQSQLQERLGWPLRGMCFDIKHNGFWLVQWGFPPADLEEAFEIAQQQVAVAPVLIPICGHRYLPAEPCEAGNPVFSVHQTDIIYYGYDLPSYFHKEFRAPLLEGTRESPRRIRFWSSLEELNNHGPLNPGS